METGRVSQSNAAASDAILARAADLFFERGFASVTTADVATAAGVSKKTLYRLFSTKEELLVAAAAAEMDAFGRRLDAITDEPGAGLTAVLPAFVRALAAQIARVGRILAGDVRRLPNVWNAIDRLRQDVIFGRLERLIGRMIDGGIVRPDVDRRLIMEMHVMLIQHLVTPAQVFRLEVSPLELYESVLKMFYGGILTGRGRRAMAREIGLSAAGTFGGRPTGGPSTSGSGKGST
jgi:AcrR family transcriptional regulator